MSQRIADLLIKIGADSYEFQQKTRQVEKGLGDLSKKLTTIGKDLSLKLTAPLAALGTMSVSLADTQMKAEAKVQQAIKSTSGAAKLSFEQLKDFASELQGKTIFGDEDILNNATAQLLTFTNIAGENFKRTQAVALDLSTVLDGDLKSASIQLGKALNDPVKNLSALSRSGIQFSKEQTEVIKQLAETGRLAEAQAVILDELERQYGGQAEAAAKVGTGAITQLKNSWGDFLELIGTAILPTLNMLVEKLQGVVAWLNTLSPTALKITVAVSGIAAAVGPVLLTLGSIVKILPILKAGLLALNTPVTALIGLAAMLATAFYSAYNSYKQFEKMDADIATQWVAEGKYKAGDEEMLNSFVADAEKKLKEHERHYAKLGSWKTLNADYRNEKAQLESNLKLWQKVVEELEKKKKVDAEAAESSRKMMEEAKNQAQEIANAISGSSTAIQQSVGLIGELEAKIDALEQKKLLPTSTIEDIATANAEIAKLKEELNNLQNITPEQLSRSQQKAPTALKPQIVAPKFDIQLPDLHSMITQVQEQVQAINDAVANGIYSWSDKTSEAMINNVAKTKEIVANYTNALMDKGWTFAEALNYVSNEVNEVMQSFDNSVNQFLAGSIEAAAESIGQVIAGDLGMEGLLKSVLNQLAGFLKQIGSQLIKFGTMIIGFKSALKSVLANPWAAIAIGGAMVTAAAVMTSLINKNAEKNVPKLAKGGLAFGTTYAMVGDNPNARIDPEVIAPLSKLKQMLGAGGGSSQNVQIALSGELTAKGRDLAYVLGKESFKVSLLGR